MADSEVSHTEETSFVTWMVTKHGLWLLKVWHYISNIMSYLTSRTEDWEADSMSTLCQPWEVRDFHQLDKRRHSTNQENQTYSAEKLHARKTKTKKWDSEKHYRNKVAAESASTSSSLSFIRLYCKSPTSQENMKFTSSAKNAAHLPSAALSSWDAGLWTYRLVAGGYTSTIRPPNTHGVKAWELLGNWNDVGVAWEKREEGLESSC